MQLSYRPGRMPAGGVTRSRRAVTVGPPRAHKVREPRSSATVAMQIDLDRLISELSSADPAVRGRAADQILRLGPGALPAAVPLVQACADDVPEVRELVVAVLEDLGPPAASDADDLIELLQHDHADVGYWAATLLGRLGKQAANAVPALAAALRSADNLAVRQRAAWALGKIGRPAAKVLPDLESAAAVRDNPRLAKLARQAIEQIQG